MPCALKTLHRTARMASVHSDKGQERWYLCGVLKLFLDEVEMSYISPQATRIRKVHVSSLLDAWSGPCHITDPWKSKLPHHPGIRLAGHALSFGDEKTLRMSIHAENNA